MKPTSQDKLNSKLLALFKARQFSPKMMAMTAAILGVSAEPAWSTMPYIPGPITVTSDGFLIGDFVTNEGRHMGAFLGAYDDLAANWALLLDAAGLKAHERHLAHALFAQRVVNAYGYRAAAR